jgi:hypothetical protein
MSLDEKSFQEQLRQFTDLTGAYHEAFRSNFVRAPELREKLDSLFKARWPEPPSGPPPNPVSPQPGGTPGIIQPDSVRLNESLSENIQAGDAEIADAHLRHEWGGDYEHNFKQVEAGRDSVFNKADPSDEIVYHAILGSPLANNPQFLEVLRTIGKEPLATNVADISRFSEQQRIDMAGVVAVDLLRHTGIPVDENHPIIRQLDEILDRKQLIDWGTRLHQRLYRR